MSKKDPETRTQTLLKAREMIFEYIDNHFNELLRIGNGAIAVQTVCMDLGIFENNTLVELANSVWGQRCTMENVKRQTKTKEETRTEYTKDAADLERMEKENKHRKLYEAEFMNVLEDALQYMADQIERSQKGFFGRLRDKIRGVR